MNPANYRSWGGMQSQAVAQVVTPHFRNESIELASEMKWLPRGNGRSYGDCALNEGGGLVDMRQLDRFIAFDPDSGLLTVESGVLLAEIVHLLVPQGWFLPVTPGTKFITVGGAIANDVHGKDHHSSGTFGEWVRELELWRSDGTVRACSLATEPGLFRATIGGIGLTGLILSATIQLKRIPSATICCHTHCFRSFEDFLALDAEQRQRHEMTVAWFDCLQQKIRGVYMAGDFVSGAVTDVPLRRPARSVPITPPVSVLSGPALGLFNETYFRASQRKQGVSHVGIDPYFYPLDRVGEWNRLYGPKGFVQLQFVVPFAAAGEVVPSILGRLRKARLGSFLAVVKTFGQRDSAGFMSFPMEGVTVALDLPRTPALAAVLGYADDVVREAGGRFYAAKDSYSTPETFRAGYPNLDLFMKHVDPAFSSSLWQRLHREQT